MVFVGIGGNVGILVGEGSGVTVGMTVGEGILVGSIVGVGLGKGVGVEIGSTLSLFCGSGFVFVTKSRPLLSESYPLPANSSTPPTPSDSTVEVFEAFRSMLEDELGTVVEKDSLSSAVPMPTLSTTVCPASLYKMTVLLAATPLVVAEYHTSGAVVPVY